MVFFFFFQAEDGIRDIGVTGVQTCALPISMKMERPKSYLLDLDLDFFSDDMDYINFDDRMECVIDYVEHADFITIATSPYFIDQKKALEVLKMIFTR